MNVTELKESLNSVRPPQYTRITELRERTPYRVVSFERCTTRIGETVAATLEGLVGEDFYLRIFLPERFMRVLTDDVIEKYNMEEGPRMSLQYIGKGKGVEFV